jgi:hypothetical protein
VCLSVGTSIHQDKKCPVAPGDATRAQISAMMVQATDGGAMLYDEVLDALEVQACSAEEDCFLSIHVVAGAQNSKVIHLSALVHNQVLSILVDSGSSHTFLNVATLDRL